MVRSALGAALIHYLGWWWWRAGSGSASDEDDSDGGAAGGADMEAADSDSGEDLTPMSRALRKKEAKEAQIAAALYVVRTGTGKVQRLKHRAHRGHACTATAPTASKCCC